MAGGAGRERFLAGMQTHPGVIMHTTVSRLTSALAITAMVLLANTILVLSGTGAFLYGG